MLTVQPEDAIVELDGSAVDRAELTSGLEVAAGDEHTLSQPRRTPPQELTVTVAESGREERSIELEPLTALTLASSPTGATVEIDGDERGTTPTKLEDLELGEHRVRFTLDNHAPVVKSVNLTKEAPQSELQVSLEKARVAAASSGRGRSGGRRPTPRSGRGGSGGGSSGGGGGGGTGSLVVNTQPWGHVFIDGRDTGRNTPILPGNPLRLSPGRHRLTVQTNNGQRFTFPITIVAGETRRFMRRLDVQ